MPYDAPLYQRLHAALHERPGITEKKMFGSYCWLLGGNMLCGVEVGRYLFRVGRDLEAQALARPGATPMIHAGRRMGGFVWVAAEHADGDALQEWIALATRFVGKLPIK